MADIYEKLAPVAAKLLTQFKQGEIQFTRVVAGAEIDPDEPWILDPDTTYLYNIDATVRSVDEKYINGTTISASERMVICPSVMTHIETDGVPVANTVVELEIAKGDFVTVDGVAKQVIEPFRIPAAGQVIAWNLVIKG